MASTISVSTEPPVPATTVKALRATKTASTVASSVTEPAGSAQGLACAPDSHASPFDSVQPAKTWPAVATAVSVAAASTLKAKPCMEPGPTAVATAPTISIFTEPPVPAATVRVLGTASKAASTVASTVTEPAGSAQGLACAPDSHASSSGNSVQMENP